MNPQYLHTSHDPPLVALSIFIAILASYTALTLAGRVAVARGRVRAAWLLGGCISMGIGIWSMHFVAMLAFQLPLQISYDVPLVLLSLLAGIGASALALFVASRPAVGPLQLLAAAALMGGGIATMHYTGMASIRMPALLGYDARLVALSLLIAFSASTVALWIFRQLRSREGRQLEWLRGGAAILMGFAIAGLHYTGMAAAHFRPAPNAQLPHGLLFATGGLSTAVVIGTLLILLLTLLISLVDHWVRVKLAGAEALRESEERYRTVVSQVQEAIFRTDATGRLTFVNPAWTEITGYDEAESLATAPFDYVHPDDRAEAMETLRQLADGTISSTRVEIRFITRHNDIRWIEVRSRVNRDARGALLGTAGTLRDVTERRGTEEALRAAREAAESANRAKSDFLSRVSHELRTPLNAILGFGQLLEIEDLSEQNQESVQHILGGGRHLLDLINEVLDIAGIESGRLRLSPEPVGVGDVVFEVLDLLRPLAARRGIVLDANAVEGCASHVLADRQRLKQVLLNLLSNAIKYNKPNGSVIVACEQQPDRVLRVTVRDTGVGIPADRLTRLFTPFERLGAENTDIEGTGLGLALSKRLAEAMGGSMGAESRRGEGSSFWIDLPLAENQVEQWERLQSTTGEHATGGPAQQGLTILYVEDNLANLALVQRILARRPDVTLIPAMQGEIALELAVLHQPDLVLLDLHLPGISGEEVLRRLRERDQTRQLPVIVVSADATAGQPQRLLERGAQAYLTKPLDVKRFIKVVDETLGAEAA